MDQLSTHEERDLLGAVEQAIRLTHGDMSPTAAIQKVAVERQYTPEKIKRMAEAFNKSKSVHVFKTAAEEDRAKPFDLADAATIIQNIYSPQQKAASSFALPEGRFDQIDFEFSDVMLEKAAGDTNAEDIHPEIKDEDLKTIDRLAKQARIEHQQFCDQMKENLRMKVAEQKQALDDALIRIVRHIEPLPDSAVQKIAQYIVNGYPTTGQGLLALLSFKTNREVPVLQKSANAVVFQTREPYLSVSSLYEAAEKMAAAEVELDMFEKKSAEPFMSSIAANTIANMLGGMGLSPDEMSNVMGSKKKSRAVEEDLDPAFYNRIKSHDAKRTFMTLSLYDPDLKNYKYQDLMKAYNSAVGTVPEAFNKPEVLKNLMIRNLQSSGIKDPFEMKQEAEISKMLRERDTASENQVLAEKMRLEARKEKERPAATTAFPMGASRSMAAIKGLTGEVAKGLDETLKEKRTRQQKFDDEARKASAPKTPEELAREQAQQTLKTVKWKPSLGMAFTEYEDALNQYYLDPAALSGGQRSVLKNSGIIK